MAILRELAQKNQGIGMCYREQSYKEEQPIYGSIRQTFGGNVK